MRKVVERTNIVKHIEYYCDVCGVKIVSYELTICCVCKKHLCSRCSTLSNDVFGGMAPSHYCRICWKVGNKYRRQIIDETLKYNDIIKAIEDDWIKASPSAE